jgi:hypothetical protein
MISGTELLILILAVSIIVGFFLVLRGVLRRVEKNDDAGHRH